MNFFEISADVYLNDGVAKRDIFIERVLVKHPIIRGDYFHVSRKGQSALDTLENASGHLWGPLFRIKSIGHYFTQDSHELSVTVTPLKLSSKHTETKISQKKKGK